MRVQQQLAAAEKRAADAEKRAAEAEKKEHARAQAWGEVACIAMACGFTSDFDKVFVRAVILLLLMLLSSRLLATCAFFFVPALASASTLFLETNSSCLFNRRKSTTKCTTRAPKRALPRLLPLPLLLLLLLLPRRALPYVPWDELRGVFTCG